MTMPTPERLTTYRKRLVERARQMVADPDNMEVRRAYMQAAFNSDWTAAAIVALADAAEREQAA